MNWISTKDALPKIGRYVLIHVTRDNWHDSSDQEGVTFVVAKREVDINAHCNPNNEKDFLWSPFGPGAFFGQEVDFWCDFRE